MNQIDLNEKVAVITGGAQGIGLAIAERMLDSGASVSLWDRDQKLVEETARSLESRGKAEAVVVDVTDLDSVKSATEKTKTSMVMIEQNYGRIVNVASVAGKDGNPNAAPYSAAKAGVIALTKSLGKELASYDIAVNCITPAAAKTRIFDQISQQHIDYMLSKIPRNRFLKVEEAASMVTWLCSAENSFTTGGVFDLSGGRSTY